MLEGPGILDPGIRETGFGIADAGPTVPYFIGSFKPLLCPATAAGGFPALGAAATMRRGPFSVEVYDLARSTCVAALVEAWLSFGPSEINTRRGPSTLVDGAKGG